MNLKVPLDGPELEAHLDAERLQKEREAAHQAALDRSRRMLEADDLDTDSESGSEADEDAANGIIIAQADPDPEDRMQMSFDIYVKGQQVRSTGFFKNNTAGTMGGVTTGGLARFRMFPFVERKGRRVDVYGEGIDVGAWVRKGREIEEDQESDEVKEAKRKQKEEEEKAVSLGLPFDPKPD